MNTTRSRTAIDALRIAGDFGTMPLIALAAALSWRYIERVTPSSDGAGVLLIPGFKTSDLALLPIRHFLLRKGYSAEGWGLGTNNGAADAEGMAILLERIEEKAESLVRRTGGPISIVGHSLGGILARAIAVRRPELVARVVTVGSPLSMEIARIASLNGILVWAMEKTIGCTLAQQIEDAIQLGIWNPLSVPHVAIHSPYDGFLGVEPLYSRADSCGQFERIETLSTHCGMCINPYTLLALADRLSTPVNDWQPFDPSRYASGMFLRGYLPTQGTPTPVSMASRAEAPISKRRHDTRIIDEHEQQATYKSSR